MAQLFTYMCSGVSSNDEASNTAVGLMGFQASSGIMAGDANILGVANFVWSGVSYSSGCWIPMTVQMLK